MSWRSRVAWTEGLFLRPQHFQQEARFVERLVEGRIAACVPHFWGFTSHAIDEALLEAGRISVTAAAGVAPDGSLFDFPAHDDAPEPAAAPEAWRGRRVHLVFPARRDGDREVAAADPASRLRMKTMTIADVATEAQTEPSEIDVAVLRPALLPDEADGSPPGARVGLPICRIADVRSDGAVVLDKSFAPPALRLEAAGGISNLAEQLASLVENRAAALAERASAPGGGASDVSDFLLLQTLNRYAPELRHLASVRTHPETLFRLAVALCGDLAAFTRPDKLAPRFAAYAHDDLAASFAPVAEEARRALSFVGDPTAVRIPLPERKYGVRVAEIADRSLFDTAQFVLAVGADMPSEDVRRMFPQQVKIGGVEVIRDLVSVQLPGVRVRPLPVSPRQIPYHAGKTYFELERAGEYWEGLKRSAGFAVHVGGAFPGVSVDLWAIREAA